MNSNSQNIIRFEIPDYRTYERRSYSLKDWSILHFYGNMVFKRSVTNNGITYFKPQLKDYPEYNLFPFDNSLWIAMVVQDDEMYNEISSIDEIQTVILNTVPIEVLVAKDIEDWSGHASVFKICWHNYYEAFNLFTEKEYVLPHISSDIAIRTIDGKNAKVYLKLNGIDKKYKECMFPVSKIRLPCVEENFRVKEPFSVSLETVLSRECLTKRSMAIKTIHSPDYSERLITGIIRLKRREYFVEYNSNKDGHEIIEFWFVYKIANGNIAKMILHQRCIDGIWDSPDVQDKYIKFLEQVHSTVKDIEADFPNLPGNFRLF